MVNILIGCTGSVASIKIPNLVVTIKNEVPSAHIIVVTTTAARRFFDENMIKTISGVKVRLLNV